MNLSPHTMELSTLPINYLGPRFIASSHTNCGMLISCMSNNLVTFVGPDIYRDKDLYRLEQDYTRYSIILITNSVIHKIYNIYRIHQLCPIKY